MVFEPVLECSLLLFLEPFMAVGEWLLSEVFAWWRRLPLRSSRLSLVYS
jgi:hypothetical protein